MEYIDIQKYLKRYSLDEKIRVIEKYSQSSMNIDGGIDIKKITQKGLPYPWELETLFMLSLKAHPEYDNKDFRGKNEKKFIEMISAIRNYKHPLWGNLSESTTDAILSPIALCQFELQENMWYKLFRYSKFFEFKNQNINMNKIFYNKFKTEYKEFAVFGLINSICFGIKKNLPFGLTQYVANRFKEVMNSLSITIDAFIVNLDKFTIDKQDYIYCLRTSYQYPFIYCNEIYYLPLPHLLCKSISSSLLYRITDGNNGLRTEIGKHVIEKYVYDIFDKSNVYDEIIAEKNYRGAHGTNAKTPDIMIRKENIILFIECKSSVPQAGLRIYDENSIIHEMNIMTENVIQVYKSIYKCFPNEYNFFKSKDNIEKNNVFGLIVRLEDNFIVRNQVFRDAAKKLSLTKEEENWMKGHIKIVSLYDVELLTIPGVSLVDYLEEQRNNRTMQEFGFGIRKGKNHKNINEDFITFKNSILDSVKLEIENMVKLGIFENE